MRLTVHSRINLQCCRKLLPSSTTDCCCKAAGILAPVPCQNPARGLKIGDGIIEAVRDPMGIDIADWAAQPAEFLDEVAADRGVAGGLHGNSPACSRLFQFGTVRSIPSLFRDVQYQTRQA
jgi:hypothetical protein